MLQRSRLTCASRDCKLQIEMLESRLHLSANQPNIVLINTDDQRFDTLEFMPFTSQNLVAKGTEFENSFVTTALCCPSRASLFTGKYAHNTGVWFTLPPTGGYENFDDSETIATMLQPLGYRTGLVGKYINGYNRAVRDSADPNFGFVPPGWDEWQALITNGYYNYTMSENGPIRSFGSRPEDYQTDVLADKARDYIFESEAQDDQPFFLYFAPFAPHLASPTRPADRHFGALDGLEPHRPPSFNEADISDKTSWAADLPKLSPERIERLDESRQRQLESLLAVDEAIAGIMETLEEADELQNTVVIFTSDNGLHWGEHRFAGKLTAFEESIRVPLVVYDARVPDGGHKTDKLALNIDIAPTLLDLAGGSIPQDMDGVSLLPLVERQAVSWRSDFLVQNWTPDKWDANGDGTKDDLYQTSQLAVRSEEWMFISDLDTGGFELYDMINDPYQLENLYGAPEFNDVANHHAHRIQQLSSTDRKGPQISDLRIESGAMGSELLKVRARVSDLDTGGSEVRSPEAFVDVPGRPGEGIPLTPVDGKFNSVSEEVELVFTAETYSQITYGKHKLLVHGRDTALNWGTFESIEVDTRIRYDDKGNLVVLGTLGDDRIEVRRIQDQVAVSLNGNPAGLYDLDNSLVIYGHDGDDLIDANGPRPKKLYGGPGDDLIRGGSGADVLQGAAGEDILVGNGGNDILRGGLHDDRLHGGLGADKLRGDAGNDVLNGGPGADDLRGGNHDDRLIGGADRDRLWGNAGNDFASFAGDHDWRITATEIVGVVSETFDSVERVVVDGGLSDNRIDARQFQGATVLRGREGNDTIFGSAFEDTIQGGDGDDAIDPGAGNDVVSGGSGNDSVLGTDGDDQLFGNSGDDLLFGGEGNDRIRGGPGADQLFGDAGDDQLSGEDGDDRLAGGIGNDDLMGKEGNDLVIGGPGNDVAFGGTGFDILVGGADDDQLWGGHHGDILIGGVGKDSLLAESGDDILVPGIATFEEDDGVLNALRLNFMAAATIDERITSILAGTGDAPPVLQGAPDFRDDLESEVVWTGTGSDWVLTLGADEPHDLEPVDRHTAY